MTSRLLASQNARSSVAECDSATRELTDTEIDFLDLGPAYPPAKAVRNQEQF